MWIWIVSTLMASLMVGRVRAFTVTGSGLSGGLPRPRLIKHERAVVAATTPNGDDNEVERVDAGECGAGGSGRGDSNIYGVGNHGNGSGGGISRRHALWSCAVVPAMLAGFGPGLRSEARAATSQSGAISPIGSRVPIGSVTSTTNSNNGNSRSRSNGSNRVSGSRDSGSTTPASRSPIVKKEKLVIAEEIKLTEAIEKETLKTARM